MTGRRRSRGPRAIAVGLAIGLAIAGCGGGEDDATAVEGASDQAGGSDGGDAGGTDGSGSSGDDGSGTVGDDEDAADIVGNPDLDLEELEEVAPEAAEALDDIDDIVSIGECSSDTVGLAMSVVPDGWQCRVLDAPVAGLDGFTLFEPGGPGLEITVGTPSPIGPPCQALQLCDEAEPIDLGSTTVMSVVDFGVPIIYGTHATVDAEIVVTSFAPLTPDQVDLVTDVLEGLVPA